MFEYLIFFTIISSISSIPKESIHIIEDLPIGSSIYTFSTPGCKTVNHTGTYRFVDGQKSSNDYFLIDPYTGRVTTKKLIDRDDFCLLRTCVCSKCEITLEVLCVNFGEIFFNDLSIIIDDRNDHSPQFPKSSLIIDVLENVPMGYLIPIDIAIDRDYGNNSIQGYNLTEKNSTNKIPNAFQLEYSKKTDLLALRLMKILDREQCQSLNYIIQAYDGGQPQPLIGDLNIHINILDVNDMSPVFERADIHVLLSESTSVGSLVARVHAYDRDTGLNGLVYYTIVALDPIANGTFLLSKETGEIRLGKRLDYEKEKSYRMKVKAQDNGPQQGSTAAFAVLNIEIKDENDNYPLITPTFNDDRLSGVEHLPNTSIIQIRENLPNGTFLGHVSISDLDQGNNGRVRWSLESNGSINIRELFNNEAFLMFTSRIFDREEQSSYQISLQAHDHGQPSLSKILNFTLIILDENDNPPRFDKNFYSINITEDTPKNTRLFHFHAIDLDEENTSNSHVEYHLQDQTRFILNSTTGELFLIGELNREEQSSYELDIIASDHGHPRPLSSIVRCRIDLIDMNDNYPIFDLSEYTFIIPETWSHLSPIGHVHATDADEYYGELSYTLEHNETTMKDQWPFELTPNGTLLLKRTSGIDYEQRSIYQFRVYALDNDGLNSSVLITIHIENRNDFCPELLPNSTALFFNTDLWSNHSHESSFNQYKFQLYDGDNDTCNLELLNFKDIFQLQSVEMNEYVLYARVQPEREYYILQFRLSDLINEAIDQSCIRYIQLVLTIGNNQTNVTVALETAREYLEALHLISQRSYSYFDLSLFNVILLFILLSIALLIGFLSIKFLFYSSKTRRRRTTMNRRKTSNHHHHHTETNNTIYRLQGPTDTQLPLLANGPGEQSLTSSFILPGNNRVMPDPNVEQERRGEEEEQQQQHVRQFNSNEYQTYTIKSPYNHNSTYDMIASNRSSSIIYTPHIRESVYEIPSNLDQQRQNSSNNSARLSNGQLNNAMHPDSSSSLTNSISRTLKTFSQVPMINGSTNESLTMTIVRLAEQEVIDV